MISAVRLACLAAIVLAGACHRRASVSSSPGEAAPCTNTRYLVVRNDAGVGSIDVYASLAQGQTRYLGTVGPGRSEIAMAPESTANYFRAVRAGASVNDPGVPGRVTYQVVCRD